MITILGIIVGCIISIIASYYMHYGFHFLRIKVLINNGYREKTTIDYDAPENNGKNLLKKLFIRTPLVPGFNIISEIYKAVLYSLNREKFIYAKIINDETERLSFDEQNEFSQDKSLFNALIINSLPDKKERDSFREIGNTFSKFLITSVKSIVINFLWEKLDKFSNYANNKFTTYQQEFMALKNPVIKEKSHYVFSSINHRKFKEKKYRLNRNIENKTYHSNKQNQIDRLKSDREYLQRMINQDSNQLKENYNK